MSFDSTTTEYEMDATTKQFVQDLHSNEGEFEPDLDVDGLSESILSRFLDLFGVGRS